MRIAINAHLVAFSRSYRQAGVSNYTARLIESLLALDPQDDFTLYIGRQAAMPENWATAPNVTRRISPLPTIRPLYRIGWEQLIAPAVLLRDRPAVLHNPVNVVPLLGPVPMIVTIHDLAFMRYPERLSPNRRRYLRTLTDLSVRRARHVIAVSEHTRREIIELLGTRPDKITTIPEAVDTTHFRPLDLAPGGADPDAAAIAADLRAKHALPERFVLFVGTFEPRKNIPVLLDAFARLRAAEPEMLAGVGLVLAGAQGWMYDAIYERIRALGLADMVRTPGFVGAAELPVWYTMSAVFVYPSVYEGFGLPPLEAMACGTPTITANVSSLPEVAGDAALLVDPTDADALADALRRVLADPALQSDMRAKGLAQVARFSWQATAARTLALYRAVANR